MKKSPIRTKASPSNSIQTPVPINDSCAKYTAPAVGDTVLWWRSYRPDPGSMASRRFEAARVVKETAKTYTLSVAGVINTGIPKASVRKAHDWPTIPISEGVVADRTMDAICGSAVLTNPKPLHYIVKAYPKGATVRVTVFNRCRKGARDEAQSLAREIGTGRRR